MYYLFPYENIIIGTLVLIIGFLFHWIGQLISVINWDFAVKIGLQEQMPKEYKVYEQATAVADSIIGWIYGVTAIGLFFKTPWSYTLLWVPGVVLVYHSLNYWFWTGNRRKDGNVLVSRAMRIGWPLANGLTGIGAIVLAWSAR